LNDAFDFGSALNTRLAFTFINPPEAFNVTEITSKSISEIDL
jgi:hypothetical protein